MMKSSSKWLYFGFNVSTLFPGRVADNLKSEDVAPVACAGITVYTALKRTEARPGQWVVIVGAAGGLGHLGIQYGKAMGLKVIGIGETKAIYETVVRYIGE